MCQFREKVKSIEFYKKKEIKNAHQEIKSSRNKRRKRKSIRRSGRRITSWTNYQDVGEISTRNHRKIEKMVNT